jgi:hypothetical protein
MRFSAGTTLDFMLGPTNEVPRARRDPAADDEQDQEQDEDREQDEPGADVGDASELEEPAIDLSVELRDAAGRTASVRLGEYGAIRRPLETYVMRRGDLEAQRFQRHWELILQTYSIPLGDFRAANALLDIGTIRTVAFVFDRVHAGEVTIDQVGFSDLDPAFLDARVDGPGS